MPSTPRLTFCESTFRTLPIPRVKAGCAHCALGKMSSWWQALSRVSGSWWEFNKCQMLFPTINQTTVIGAC